MAHILFMNTIRANNIRLGTNLKALMRQRGISLREISVQTKIPYSTLHTWLENRQPKDIVKVKALADFLSVSLHYLLFGEDEKIGLLANELPRPGLEGLAGVYEVIIRRRE